MDPFLARYGSQATKRSPGTTRASRKGRLGTHTQTLNLKPNSSRIFALMATVMSGSANEAASKDEQSPA